MVSKILYFELDTDENVFYDENGERVDSILEFITTNDLYLFRQDPGYYCIFEYRHDKSVLIELYVEE